MIIKGEWFFVRSAGWEFVCLRCSILRVIAYAEHYKFRSLILISSDVFANDASPPAVQSPHAAAAHSETR